MPLGFITVILLFCPDRDPVKMPVSNKTPRANQPARFFILFLPLTICDFIIPHNDGISSRFIVI